MPLPEGLFRPPPPSVEFVDRQGHPLREVPAGECAFHRWTRYADIPPALVQATLAAEDRRFWGHPGVDWRAVLRAAADLLRHRRVVSGASTISMQLVKLARPRPRTLRTKLIESAQALRLEQVWDKPRILEEYLNRLDYGGLNVGCAAAADFLFGKPLADLSVAECALLAGLPQGPSRLNPHAHPERARRRQQWILRRMLAAGFLTPDECARAVTEPVRLARPRRPFLAPHFADLALGEWRRGATGASSGAVGGPTLRTTLDLELNRFVEQCVARHLGRLRAQRVRNGAVVVLDNRSGEVLALVGSEDYFAPDAGQVNGALAPRSAGSTLKPFTYLLAFEAGANPATVLADVRAEFATRTGVFIPENYDRSHHGPVSCRLALANSLNIPAVRALAAAGGPEALQRRLQACGLTTLTNTPEHYGLGLTLGNAETRLLELVNAYAALARLGEFKPWRVFPAQGARTPAPAASAPSPTAAGRRIADPGAAWLIADILRDNRARALAFGLESSLRFDFPVACKTGTSSDFRDNWALGYTPEFTVGVWVGNFDGEPMGRVSGVTGAAPILREIVTHLRARFGTTWYPSPDGLAERWVNPLTGKAVGAGPVLRLPPVKERFLPGALPPTETVLDYDAAGRLRLPAEYREWLASPENPLGDLAIAEAAPGALRIVSPPPGAVYFLDPDLPASAQRVRLRAEGAGRLRWHSDTLPCQPDAQGVCVPLRVGRHVLTVEAPDSGTRQETWIVVKGL